MRVRLNIDLGESPDEDCALYEYADIANIACGGHAGDERTMAGAIEHCIRARCAVGAHPSYPDRVGFGRRQLDMSLDQLAESLRAQCATLNRLAALRERRVEYAKPHGALYHDADRNERLAHVVVGAIIEAIGPHVAFIGPPSGGGLARACAESGTAYLREGFADRAMRVDGSLVPRSEPASLIDDPERAAAQAERLAATGTIDTICVHGDQPAAFAVARAVRERLDRRAIRSRP